MGARRMDNNNEDEPLYIEDYYVKRPDLRPNEISPESDFDQCSDWQWWITAEDLYENELKTNHEDPCSTDLEVNVVGTRRLTLPVQEVFTGHVIREDGSYDPNDPREEFSPDRIASVLPAAEFFTEEDPACIIEYFCKCHEWGVYPPPWIMNHIYKQFSQYLDDKLRGRHKRFGQYFGESAAGDRRNYFGKMAFLKIMSDAMLDIHHFRLWFGVNKEAAIDLATQYLKTYNNPTTHRFNKGYPAVEKHYNSWQKIYELKNLKEYFDRYPPSRPDKMRLVRRYPREALDAYPVFKEYYE